MVAGEREPPCAPERGNLEVGRGVYAGTSSTTGQPNDTISARSSAISSASNGSVGGRGSPIDMPSSRSMPFAVR